MAKFNGWGETIISVLILGEHFLLIGLPDAQMVTIFIFGINLSVFSPKPCNIWNWQCIKYSVSQM